MTERKTPKEQRYDKLGLKVVETLKNAILTLITARPQKRRWHRYWI